ncbi:MAG: GNAT family N-acetyltransferase [Candidatus Peregrinibacteria bacterium]|nr:GNAT family N-acetyltransferase [Candidatus Peregrinibacteria bacterium]
MTELQAHITSLDPHQRHRPREEFDAPAYIRRLHEKVNAGNGIILFAVDGEDVMGMLVGVVLPFTPDDALECYPFQNGRVIELYVADAARRSGVGKLLMRAAEEEFRRRGCGAVIVECFGPNLDAHAFYRSIGYEDRSIDLLKLL